MGSMWEGLHDFLDDSNVKLDNNRTERARRGVVIGRKNHYGSRSQRGTEVAALFYSLIESAKLAGVGPHRTCVRRSTRPCAATRSDRTPRKETDARLGLRRCRAGGDLSDPPPAAREMPPSTSDTATRSSTAR
jgi:hypothetical protein